MHIPYIEKFVYETVDEKINQFSNISEDNIFAGNIHIDENSTEEQKENYLSFWIRL